MTSLIPEESKKADIYKGIDFFGMSDPIKLSNADLTKPFIYHRKHGVFYIRNGYHSAAMTKMLCWELGVYNKDEIDTELLFGKKRTDVDIGFLSDYFIENTKGTCFLSSNSPHIFCGKIGYLDFRELTFFKGVSYLT